MQLLYKFRQTVKWMSAIFFGAVLCTHALAAQPEKAKQIDPIVRDFIKSNYGKWEARNKGWRPEDGSFVYHVCDVSRLTTADGARYLLAMCGNFADTNEDGTPASASDATGGQTDLYVLKPASNGTRLEPVIKQTNIASGNFGNAAPVSIEQFGPHLYGFVIEDGTVLQGYAETSRSIWLPRPNRFVLAARRINVSMSNSGTEECGTQSRNCEDKDFTITPDTTSTAEVYPLKIHETGSKGDKTIDANYVVRFDPVKEAYIVPKVVSEGY